MAIARFGRQAKRSYGFCLRMTAVAILGLCFIFIWSVFSSPSSSVTSQRSTFNDIPKPVSSNGKVGGSKNHKVDTGDKKVKKFESDLKKEEEKVNGSVPFVSVNEQEAEKEMGNERKDGKLPKEVDDRNHGSEGSEGKEVKKDEENEEGEADDKEGELVESEGKENEEVEVDGDLITAADGDQEIMENVEDESGGLKSSGKKRKKVGPLFDPKARYTWRLCSTKSKHNYIPCIDIESAKLQSYRHHERSCPRTAPMCLVPLPHEGYSTPVSWPESKLKILYKNVAHPKLAAFIKMHSWVVESGEYLTFPQNQSEFKGGILHYLDYIEEMVPDIEWGKNIRIVLDIGCTDSSFGASLHDKNVLTLTLGLKDDLVDLAQVALERGFPVAVSPFGTRRLPFPSGVFDAIHCGECRIHWHSDGAKLLLEMNRILRPGGYFILSTERDTIEDEEAMSTVTASICWNILAHKTDEVSEVGVKIYQKPESNDIYELRRKKNPPLCKENENPDAAWYTPMKTCLHTIPSAIEQRGTEWPEEWPKRLETFPDWMNNREKLIADTEHWKAIFNKSYLTGMGVEWSNVRNIMDMKAINGGCKQPVAIVVEMDRVLRPGGWAILRDKMEILDPLQEIFRSLHWEVRMTYAQDKEGLMCVQKTMWRP
ncbi:probable methyltransferase PMT28 isoform X2 [Cornus florida]|uniref:probable methyltransferase PMT28 isoform X2 n=1 Tax=Cornus florida TaxID=4283 RepID=UPI00289A48E1|nr:probable methyltransferase PMT28 isoform X2 [Cornus florida]